MLIGHHFVLAVLVISSPAVAVEEQQTQNETTAHAKAQQAELRLERPTSDERLSPQGTAERPLLRSPSFESDDILILQHRKTLCDYVCPR
jgi:hypothetical protein